jgi:hypothetical protein
MKLYHYAPKKNTIMKDGLFSISKIDRNLRPYAHRAGSENKEDILRWMDSTFYGRSRSVSCLIEQIKWQGNDLILKKIVDGTELFSFELDDLIKDGLVESIWCKKGSDAGGLNEKFYQVKPEEIDLSALAWEKVDASKDLLYAVIRHYMIVLKDGFIPSKYITKENQC